MINKYKLLNLNIKDISDNCTWGDYYKLLDLPYGLCFGLTAMWGQAHIVQDTKTFYKRLEILTEDYRRKKYQLSDIINTADLRQSGNYGAPSIISSIRAFLDGVLAYHSPEKTFLVKKEYNISSQNLLKASKYVGNHALKLNNVDDEKHDYLDDEKHDYLDDEKHDYLDDESPLFKIYNEPFYGCIGEYCEMLKSLIEKCKDSKYPCFLHINSSDHSISIGFKEKELLLYDANSMSFNEIKADRTYDYTSLMRTLFNAFSLFGYRQNLALNIEIYICPKMITKYGFYESYYETTYLKKIREYSKTLLTNYIDEFSFSKHHKKRAKYVNSTLYRFENIADTLHYFQIEKKLITGYKDKKIVIRNNHYLNNKMTNAKITGSYYKIIIEIIAYIEKIYSDEIFDINNYRKLLVNKIINQRVWETSDIFVLSCERGHIEIVDLLLQKHADVNKVMEDGATPLLIAHQYNYMDIVALLTSR